MYENNSKLAERIRFHYEEKSFITKFMDFRRVELPNFEPIPYNVILENTSFPEDESGIEDLAQNIGSGLANLEFSQFIILLKKVPCKTVKTTLDSLIKTLDQTHDELWDLGFDINYLFMPWVLKSEIRNRNQSVGAGIGFSTQIIHPTLANELGHSQIIFANKHNFGKTYPQSINKQILVSKRTDFGKSEVDCQIVQNIHFRNLESMRRIIVIDAENSDFLNPDKYP
jgi:hypothetical protein